MKKTKYIGVDVGGTKILLEVFDSKLNVLEKIKVPTEIKKGRKGIENQICKIIDSVFNASIKGIGVAVPGIVDINSGTLVYAPHLPTGKNFPLLDILKKRYKIPMVIDNDINAFLVAERENVNIKKHKNIIAVMIGTGVGGAIISNGKLVYGKNGFAGEIGHIIIRQNSQLKSFEQNTAGSFIPQIAKELGIKNKVTSYDLTEEVSGKKKIVKHITEQCGIALANLNLIFNPEVFVLGGSMYRLFMADKKQEIKDVIKKHALNGKSPKLITASKKTSVAEGIVRILLNNAL